MPTRFRLRLILVKAGPVLIEVFDITGKQIILLTENVLKGNNMIQLKSTGLKSGIYLVAVTTNGERKTSKIVKQ